MGHITNFTIPNSQFISKFIYLGFFKVGLIAKWVARKPKILIVDEPTRGIDVGAKAEVHALLARLASEGVGVIVISSDLPEGLAVSDRIIVIKDGHIGAELSRAAASQERVMSAATD